MTITEIFKTIELNFDYSTEENKEIRVPFEWGILGQKKRYILSVTYNGKALKACRIEEESGNIFYPRHGNPFSVIAERFNPPVTPEVRKAYKAKSKILVKYWLGVNSDIWTSKDEKRNYLAELRKLVTRYNNYYYLQNG